jgi:hypothetical protein
MARNKEIPDLFEQYMDESGKVGQWITVQEIRTHFGLDEAYAPALAGFLRRIHNGPFFSCQYRVDRIEEILVNTPQRRYIKKYLVIHRKNRREKTQDGPGNEQIPDGKKSCGTIRSAP